VFMFASLNGAASQENRAGEVFWLAAFAATRGDKLQRS
jgi:hypothetical protein